MSNPFKIIEPTVIAFSGGRTSAYMLWRILQSNNGKLPEDAIVCFTNTLVGFVSNESTGCGVLTDPCFNNVNSVIG